MALRIAYVGAGSFTNGYMYPQLSQHDLELAAVCDLVEEKATHAQGQYGFKAVYTDFRKMLEVEKPEAVFCVGGPKVHYGVGMEVLDRGFPLYVQKSPAPTSAATREMAELASSKGVVCHVGFNLRSSPASLQANRILGGDEFGTPLAGMFRYGLCFGKTMEDVVMDQHCHLVDLAKFLMGDIRSAQATRSSRPDARDYVVTLEFESGAVGTLNFTSGQVIDKEFIYFEVTGEGTFLYSHGCANLIWLRRVEGDWWRDPQPDYSVGRGLYGRLVTHQALGYLADVANFVAAVKGEAEDRSPISGAIGTMEVCEEIVRQVGHS